MFMRISILFGALVVVAIGVAGLVSPDVLIDARRAYIVDLRGLYAIGIFRLALGILLIAGASGSRLPRTLRVIGVVACLQGLSQILAPLFMTYDRMSAMLEWELALPSLLLRAGALIALSLACLLVYAVTGRPRRAA